MYVRFRGWGEDYIMKEFLGSWEIENKELFSLFRVLGYCMFGVKRLVI